MPEEAQAGIRNLLLEESLEKESTGVRVDSCPEYSLDATTEASLCPGLQPPDCSGRNSPSRLWHDRFPGILIRDGFLKPERTLPARALAGKT
jgi:hypothetical protein